MKARTLPLAFAVGLAALVVLTIGVTAQDTLSRGAAWTMPPVAPAGPGYRPLISFTPVATTYLPLAMKSDVIYFDDFSNPNSGWVSGENADLKYGYLNGEYQILLKTTGATLLVTPDLVLPGDYRIEVDARQASSNQGSYGLMFGIQLSGSSYEGHQFMIFPASQQYLLEKRNMDGSWQILIDQTYSPAIQPGMGANHLRVDRIGTAIHLYANGVLLTTFTDGSFTSSGRDAGVRAYSYDSAPVDVRFDNFLVRRVEAASPTATPTGTSTSTPTSTATRTHTPTPTGTGTSTSTPTSTATHTHTPTPTPTSTSTPTPTRTATPTGTPTPTNTTQPTPVAGHWAGTTSRGHPMSFEVSLDSTQWISFTLETDFSAPSCGVSSGTLETTVPGPGSITNNQFSYSSSTYSFTGQFTSATTSTGTYNYNNFQIVIGLPYPPYVCFYYLTQSGTWSASGP